MHTDALKSIGRLVLSRNPERSLADNDDLCTCFFTHSVDRSRHAGSRGILVASGGLCHDRNGAIRTTDNGTARFEWRHWSSVDNEANILGCAFPDCCRAGRHAKECITLRVRGTGGRGCSIGSPLHVNNTWRGSGPASVARIASLRRVWLRADIFTALRLRGCIADQRNQQHDQQNTPNSKTLMNRQDTPHNLLF